MFRTCFGQVLDMFRACFRHVSDACQTFFAHFSIISGHFVPDILFRTFCSGHFVPDIVPDNVPDIVPDIFFRTLSGHNTVETGHDLAAGGMAMGAPARFFALTAD